MPKLLRLLLVAACALALATSGCVEIVNPQFDARYRTGTRQIPTAPYAVFAVWHSAEGTRTTKAPSATIVVVDTAKNSVVQSITLDGVVAISDVGGPADTNAVLATLEDGFVQVGVRSGVATPLVTATVAGLQPRGAAFDGNGVRVFWRTDAGGTLVSRRTGSWEQTAGARFRNIMSRYKTVTNLLLMSANERETYVVARTRNYGPIPLPSGAAQPAHAVSSRVLYADFPQHTIVTTGTPTPWPLGFVLDPAVHADRAVFRWGLPIETADGTLAFVSLTGRQHSLSATTTVGMYGPEIVFEPGGMRYLQVQRVAVPFGAGSVSWAVAERSVGTTSSHIVYQQELPTPGRIPIDPLGVIEDDTFAFGVIRPGGTGTREASGAPEQSVAMYDLHLRAIDTGRDVVAASIPSPSKTPRADYLGSFTPGK